MVSPTEADAASVGSSVICQTGVPSSSNSHCPSTWKVNTGAPTTTIRSAPRNARASPPGAAGRKPANSGCNSGKLERLDIGLAQTAALACSATATIASTQPLRSISGPTTKIGFLAARIAAPSRTIAAGSGANSVAMQRTGGAVAGRAQSSDGTDTNVGPRGCCMAVRKACAIAAGTSSARAGSALHFT